MFNPKGHPPSKDDLIVLGIAAGLATIVAWIRTAVDGRAYAIGVRLGVIAAGGIIGLISGLLCLAYGINVFITVAVTALLGATGEFVIIGLTKLGLAVADDPVAMVEKVVRLRAGLSTKGEEK